MKESNRKATDSRKAEQEYSASSDFSGEQPDPDLSILSGLAENSHKPRPALSRENILKLQRTIGNQAVQRLISANRASQTKTRAATVQRVLTTEATRAFKTAIKQNTEYTTALENTDKYMPKDYQEKLTNVTGTTTKVKQKFAKAGAKRDQQRNLKDYVRAYLLKSASKVLHELFTTPEKHAKYPTPEAKQKQVYSYLPRSLWERDKYSALLKKGVNVTETMTFLQSQGFEAAAGMAPDAVKRGKVVARGPRIEVRSTTGAVPIMGVVHRAHLFIVYTNAEGQQFFLRGGPGYPVVGLANGYTTADIGPYSQNSIDFDPSAPVVTVMKGEQAATKFDAMLNAAKSINSMNVPYEARGGIGHVLQGENCNSTAYTILKQAGVPTSKPSGVHPGWGQLLGSFSKKGNAYRPQEDGPPTPTRLKGGADANVDFYQDQVGLNKKGTLPGGSNVTMLVPNPAELPPFVKIKSGEVTGYIKKEFVADPRLIVPGRQFAIKGDGGRPIDVLSLEGGIDIGMLADGELVDVLTPEFSVSDVEWELKPVVIRFEGDKLGRVIGNWLQPVRAGGAHLAPAQAVMEEFDWDLDDEAENPLAAAPAPAADEVKAPNPFEGINMDEVEDLGGASEKPAAAAAPASAAKPILAEAPVKVCQVKPVNKSIAYIKDERGSASDFDYIDENDSVKVFVSNFEPGKPEWNNVLIKIQYTYNDNSGQGIGYLYGRELVAGSSSLPAPTSENAEGFRAGPVFAPPAEKEGDKDFDEIEL